VKILIGVTTICAVFFIVVLSLVPCQAQEIEGSTIVGTVVGPQVCLGRWVPPRDVGLSGYCEGKIVSLSQLTATSAVQSAEKLDQMLGFLASIDQKLALSNDQFDRLIETTVKTQNSIDLQVGQVSALLRETINKRFEALPDEILANEAFKEEITRLKEDILEEVEKHYSKPPTPAKK